MPRGRSYRNYKRMRQRLQTETECYTLLERRQTTRKKRINRAIELGNPAMVDLLQRKAAQKYAEELDKLEHDITTYQMRKIARDGKISDLYRRYREEQKDDNANEEAYRALRGRT